MYKNVWYAPKTMFKRKFYSFLHLFFLFFKDCIYLFVGREREHTNKGSGRQRELLSKEPDMGLDPRTQGS